MWEGKGKAGGGCLGRVWLEVLGGAVSCEGDAAGRTSFRRQLTARERVGEELAEVPVWV